MERGRERMRGGLHSQSRCFFLGPMISWVVALHTVLDTAEPVTLCWAAVIRSVRLWPDISAARPPPLPLGSRRGLGPPSARGSPPPTAPPTPHRLPARLPAWGGAQGRAPPPAPRAPARAFSPTGSHTKSGATPGSRASASAHPFPGQLEPDRARGPGSCRKMAAPGSSSELSGLPLGHVTRVPPPARFLPPLLPSLSSPARPPPSLRRGKSGAAPARYVVEPARRAQQEARPRGTARPAASRDAPCQQVARGRAPRVVGGMGGRGGPLRPSFTPEARTFALVSEADAVGLTKR